MKKVLFLLLLSPLFLAGCNDDDKDKEGVDPQPITATLIYQYEVSQDLFDAVSINIAYTDADGTEKSEAMGTTSWSKTVANAETPITQKMKITFTAKDDFTPTKASYSFMEAHTIRYSTTGGSKNIITNSHTSGVSLSMVSTYLERTISQGRTYTLEIE